MRKCPACGYPNPDNLTQCFKCKTPIVAIQQRQSPPPVVAVQGPQQPNVIAGQTVSFPAPISLVQPLDTRGEKLLGSHVGVGEELLVKLKGSFGEALVITTKCLYVLKWGFMTGQTFGGKCNSYEFRNITGLQIRHSVVTGVIQIVSPGTQDNRHLGYWEGGDNDALKSDNAVTFSKKDLPLFMEAAKVGRMMIERANTVAVPTVPSVAPAVNNLDQLAKLAELRDNGIITQDEFDAKKKQILGI